MVRTRLFTFMLLICAIALPTFGGNPFPGAIFTTDGSCNPVDMNIYAYREDVFLNGGPNNANASGLPQGFYYVQVTDPSGAAVLGRSATANFEVGSDGRAVGNCSDTAHPGYSLWSNLLSGSSNFTAAGYDLTPNSGLEYKVWISAVAFDDPDFKSSDSKTDNFKVHNPHILVTESCPGEVFTGDTINVTVTVTNTGSITLNNIAVTTSCGAMSVPDGTLAPGASYTAVVSCPASAAGTFTTATSSVGYDTDFPHTPYEVDSATSCDTTILDLGVSKTAATSYTRTWTWSLSKTANDSGTVTILPNTSAQVCYTLSASATSADSAWAVSGSITVHNPAATISASVAGVADSIAGAVVSCPGSAPYSIAPGADLVCTYTASLAGANNGTNTGTATLNNNNSGTHDFSGSAAYAFGDPTTVVHGSATLADAGISLANADSTGSAGWTVSQSALSQSCAAPGCTVTFCATVANTSATCDLHSTSSNGATLAIAGGGALSSSASTDLYSGACPSVCTLTIGYWKTHAGFTGNNADRVTQYLPKSLGSGGGKTVAVTAAPQAVFLLQMSGDASNGINKLYAQELAAKLNIAHGSSSTAINSALAAADAFLVSYNANDWNALSKTQKTNVNNWMSTFDSYNNGLIGPGHCN